MNLESEHLLGDEGDGLAEKVHQPRRRNIRPVLLHLLLVSIYTSIFAVLVWLQFSKPACHNEIQAIDGLDIQHQDQPRQVKNISFLHGNPNPELDEKWDSLLHPKFIRVTKEELQKNDRSSVKLSGDNEYLAWLGIFHELHCVDFIRKWVYRDYYYPNRTAEIEYRISTHTDHCLDQITAVLMCHPDYSSLTTLEWNERSSRPMVEPKKTLHSCVNWDRLIGSMQDRVVEPEEIAVLEKPAS